MQGLSVSQGLSKGLFWVSEEVGWYLGPESECSGVGARLCVAGLSFLALPSQGSALSPISCDPKPKIKANCFLKSGWKDSNHSFSLTE